MQQTFKEVHTMIKYKEFRPTVFDSKGSFLGSKQQEWYVLPIGQNRESTSFDISNFTIALKLLGGERDNIIEVHRFGHWGPGWFEIIIVNHKAGRTLKIAQKIESDLESYPILDESDFSEREVIEANEIWESCYSWKERIEYIREYIQQFEFRDYQDMISCARGKYFAGYASDLINF